MGIIGIAKISSKEHTLYTEVQYAEHASDIFGLDERSKSGYLGTILLWLLYNMIIINKPIRYLTGIQVNNRLVF